MDTATSAFINRIAKRPRPRTIAEFDQLAALIDESLPAIATAAQLHALHERIYEQLGGTAEVPGQMDGGERMEKPYLWHVVLINARLAPGPCASAWHMYARQLFVENRDNIFELAVARNAYRWSGNRLGAARVGIALCHMLAQSAQFADAAHIGTDTLPILEQEGLAVELSSLQVNLAAMYVDQAAAEEAQRARRYAQDAIDTVDRALAREDAYASEKYLGLLQPKIEAHLIIGRVAEEDQNDYALAEQHYQHARRLLAAMPPNFNPQRFHLHLNQGIMALRAQHHAQATREFLAASEFQSGKLEQRELLLYQALQAIQLGDDHGARRNLERFAEINLAEIVEERKQIQDARASLFNAMLHEQFHADMAKHMDLSQVAAVFRQAGIPLDAALAHLELARLHFKQAQSADARANLSRARELLDEHVPERRSDVELYECLYDPAYRPEQLRSVLERHLGQGDWGTVAELATRIGQAEESDDPAVALPYYGQAIEAIMEMRKRIRVPHNSILFMAHRRTPFERAFALQRERNPREAFRTADRLRRLSLADEQHYHEGARLLIERDPQLSQLHRRLIALEDGNHWNNLAATGVKNTRALRKQARNDAEHSALEEEYVTALARAYTCDEAPWLDIPPLDIDALQALLDSGSALVAYQVIDDQDKGGLWAIVVTQDSIKSVHVLPSRHYKTSVDQWNDLEKKVLQIKGVIPSQHDANAMLGDLYNRFMAPVLKQLDPAPRELIIVYDDQMPFFPMHAAHSQEHGYLIERMAVSYAPSAWALLYRAQQERQRQRAEAGAVLAGWTTTLPKVRPELEAIAAIVGARPHIDSSSKDELLGWLPAASLIHLATHGSFNPQEHPRFARLEWNADSITAHDLYGVPLQAALFTLSACNVGQHGKGMQGMVSAALVSGASAVLASLWQVDDSYAPTFMAHFYEALFQAGQSRGEALRTAQRAAIAKDKHPAYWALFYLTGVSTHLPPTQ